MSSSSRELIQISLGGSANAVTAHSLNLQGLTSVDEGEGCEPYTTHRVEDNFLVPRCLLVDEPTRFYASAQISSPDLALQQHDYSPFRAFTQASPFGIQSLDSAFIMPRVEVNDPWNQTYQAAAVKMAYSTHSPYYRTTTTNGLTGSHNSNVYQSSSTNDRHVDWDNLGDEKEEEHQEASAMDLDTYRRREQNVWQTEQLPQLQSQLVEASQQLLVEAKSDLHWMDYLMPPFSESSKIALEYSHQSTMHPHWDVYYNNTNPNSDWMQDTLLEGMRHLLEASDGCQGFMITTEGHGMYAGMATALLQEMQQEVKSAGRMVFHITNPESELNEKSEDDDANDSRTWQPAHVQRVRQHLSNGMALHDFAENAHTVLPLTLPFDEKSPALWQASARIAMAMEHVMLPLRLGSNAASRRIGVTNFPNGDYDTDWGSTLPYLTMSDYLQCLQPSSQYKVLELDMLSQKVEQNTLWDSLLAGTSLQRDSRMRQQGTSRYRPRDVPPGGWLQDSRHQGLLSTLSPSHSDKFSDRSLHHHFSLHTAARPVALQANSDPRYQHDPSAQTLAHYLTALIQGMGIQYRPERSTATVGSQSIGNLVQGGVGTYWKTLCEPECPTVAVMSNSTRIYPFLDLRASNMKDILGPRYRGFVQRDVMNGVLPEAEDCQEALEACYDLRDVYQPPDGSGLVASDDETDDF